MVDISNKDCLCNLSLLPKKENISKNNKALREIVDPWLIQQIATYADIQQCDFEKYSDLSNINDMKEHRKSLYEKAFKENRDSILKN